MSEPFPADPTEHLKLLWREGTAQEVQGGKATRPDPKAPSIPPKKDRRS